MAAVERAEGVCIIGPELALIEIDEQELGIAVEVFLRFPTLGRTVQGLLGWLG